MSLSIILIVIAVVLFALAALNVNSPRFSLGWAGMVFFALSLIVEKV
jgi:hypothetical protein